jgi:hypothetical protein
MGYSRLSGYTDELDHFFNLIIGETINNKMLGLD